MVNKTRNPTTNCVALALACLLQGMAPKWIASSPCAPDNRRPALAEFKLPLSSAQYKGEMVWVPTSKQIRCLEAAENSSFIKNKNSIPWIMKNDI